MSGIAFVIRRPFLFQGLFFFIAKNKPLPEAWPVDPLFPRE